ncbi:MAG: hypothetical protein ACOY9Y_04335 [Bacillota bacterium]
MRKKFCLAVVLLLIAGLLAASVPAFAAEAGGERMGLGRWKGGLIQIVADFLEIDVKDLFAQRKEGKSLTEIAQSAGVEQQELVNQVISVRQEQLSRLVAEGKITQDQAALCTEAMKPRIETRLNRTFVGPAGDMPWKEEFMQRQTMNRQRGFGLRGKAWQAK